MEGSGPLQNLHLPQLLLRIHHCFAFLVDPCLLGERPTDEVIMPLMCEQAENLVKTLKREVGYGKPMFVEA